jgi:hypothetical protein
MLKIKSSRYVLLYPRSQPLPTYSFMIKGTTRITLVMIEITEESNRSSRKNKGTKSEVALFTKFCFFTIQ